MMNQGGYEISHSKLHLANRKFAFGWLATFYFYCSILRVKERLSVV